MEISTDNLRRENLNIIIIIQNAFMSDGSINEFGEVSCKVLFFNIFT